jgi:SAM-dependent methyltransferase
MFKADSYDIGRPAYPRVFFEYLYKEAGLTPNSIIADIGSGTGKITKGFLELGNKVFAVEPDNDMMTILKRNLSRFSNCFPVLNTAENTGISTSSIDLIFCGNSYHWFERSRVIPEFKRIIKNNNKQTDIVIASLGPCDNVYTEEYLEIEKRFARSVPKRTSNTSDPFRTGAFVTKTFDYTVYNGFIEFLNGSLSSSYAPTPEEESFDPYCQALKSLFEKYSINGKLESRFQLSCKLGHVEDLIQ